jgi:hypothetical protein
MSRNWKDLAFEGIAQPTAIGCFLVMSALSLVLVMLMPLLLIQESHDKVNVTEIVTADGQRTQVTERRVQEATSYTDADGTEIVRIEKYTVYNTVEKEAQP